MKKSRGVSGRGGAALAVLFTVGATVAMQAQSARNDGITVHGHWTIDIVNPDGRLASHNEFENALEATGTTALSGVLARNFVPAAWQLALYGANGAGACERLAAPPPSDSWVVIAASGATYTVMNGIVNWTTSAQLTPGAPFFDFPGGSQFGILWDFTLGRIDLPFTDLEGDGVTGFLTGPVPQQVSLVQNATTERLDWQGLAPGNYAFTISLSDSGGHSNLYNVSIIAAGQAAPDPGSGEPVPCIAVEPSTGIPTEFANAWFPTLGFTVVDDSPNHQHLELTGNVTATIPEPVTQVQSVLRMTNGATLPFSARTLDTPIQVVAGQKIYVKVVLSFT
jgi:hypothetical protein